MPIRSPRWPYTEASLEHAPHEWSGVYAIWAGDELLHIGHAPGGSPTVQAALRDHLRGRCSVCTGKATHYGWELTQDPERRGRELLEEFRAAHGRLPKCNAQTGTDKRSPKT